jgi:hypothetical protein
MFTAEVTRLKQGGGPLNITLTSGTGHSRVTRPIFGSGYSGGFFLLPYIQSGKQN